jgi:hypothetical protein
MSNDYEYNKNRRFEGVQAWEVSFVDAEGEEKKLVNINETAEEVLSELADEYPGSSLIGIAILEEEDEVLDEVLTAKRGGMVTSGRGDRRVGASGREERRARQDKAVKKPLIEDEDFFGLSL